MNEQRIEPRPAEPQPQLSERLWQEWQWKNRERDRIGARNRRRFLAILLAAVFVAALVENYIVRS